MIRARDSSPAGSAPRHRASHTHAGPRTYVVVAVFLFVLTIMEVGVFYIPPLAPVLVPLLIILAGAKFALVAMFYMHLRFDHTWFSYLFIPPLFVAAGVAVALLWLFGVFGSTGLGAGG